MIDQGKKNVLGVLVNAIDYEAAVARIIFAAKSGLPYSVSALAVHGVMTGVQDAQHRYRLNHLDLVVPDGHPVRGAMNLLYDAGLKDRVYGPTLTLKLCEQAARENLPIYFYGSKSDVLEALSSNLRKRFPNLQIVGAQPSKFRQTSAEEKQQIATEIRDSGAKIVFVGLGCPRQEVWAYEYRDLLPMPLIAVGAAFDFHAGLLAQAPTRVQDAGFEWLFRLLREPRRLWRRYILLSPRYLWLLAQQKLRIRTFDPNDSIAPVELRYG